MVIILPVRTRIRRRRRKPFDRPKTVFVADESSKGSNSSEMTAGIDKDKIMRPRSIRVGVRLKKHARCPVKAGSFKKKMRA